MRTAEQDHDGGGDKTMETKQIKLLEGQVTATDKLKQPKLTAGCRTLSTYPSPRTFPAVLRSRNAAQEHPLADQDMRRTTLQQRERQQA